MINNQIITAKEWRAGHPEAIGSLPTDMYYANLCTNFLKITDVIFSHCKVPSVGNRAFALTLGHYIEDIVTRTHVFATFRKLNEILFEKRLPFYEIGEDYLDDEVNSEDIKFLVWNHVQTLRGDSAILNPDNQLIDIIANELFPFLVDAFEDAPEVPELHEFIYDKKKYDNFIDCRPVLVWLLLSNPFTSPYDIYTNINVEVEQLHKKEKQLDPTALLSAVVSQHLFTTPLNYFALKANAWLAEMLLEEGMAKEAKRVSQLQHTGIKTFEITSTDDKALHLVDVVSAKKYTVKMITLPDPVNAKENRYMITDLANFGGRSNWEINGLSYFTNNAPQEKEDKPKSKKTTYDYYLEKLGGKRLVFFKNYVELTEKLLNDAKKVDMTRDISLELKRAKGILVFLNSDGALNISTKLVGTIPDLNNPFFRKMDKPLLLGAALNSSLASSEMVQYFKNHGWYKDITLTSKEEKDNNIFQENFEFFMRYFRRGEFTKLK